MALKRLAIVALALLCASLASAQTGKSESCEKSQPDQLAVTVKAGEKYAVGFCGDHPPFVEPVLRESGKRDTRNEARFIPDAGAASNGLWFFATSLLDFPAGTHSLTIDYMKLNLQADVVVTPMPKPLVLTVTATTPNDPACGIIGTQAVTVTVTRWQPTTGLPGSRMRVDFQLSSSSPVSEVAIKLNGEEVARQAGSNLSESAGQWITTPASGIYKLAVWAKNAYGCTRETVSLFDVVVR